MFNVYDKIRSNPDYYKQLRCGDSLITLFHCLFESKFQDAWSHFNYIVYLVDGQKVWHTPHGAYHLKTGDCVFVRKGACLVEHYSEQASCLVFLFMPDEFICESLKSKTTSAVTEIRQFDTILPVDNNAVVQAFFQSMMSYFDSDRTPDDALLELKFKELVLTLADNDANTDLRSYFASLLKQPRAMTLQEVMEANFCFNLKLEEFARLTARSLSAFKRDFKNLYHTSPGKWLLERRLSHAQHLLRHGHKAVSEAAFESGFESASHFSRAFRQRFGTAPMAVKQPATL